jgi:hypothetical protein
MITEVITAPIWRANPECMRKCYLYDAERNLGGGAYLWKTYFETPVVADNLVQQTIEEGQPVEEGQATLPA